MGEILGSQPGPPLADVRLCALRLERDIPSGWKNASCWEDSFEKAPLPGVRHAPPGTRAQGERTEALGAREDLFLGQALASALGGGDRAG